MRKIGLIIIILLIAGTVFGAKYAGDPYSLGVGARALGMGGATIAGPFDASVGYWNPAGLNYLQGKEILAMHAETFGSLLNHEFIGFGSYHDSTATFRSYGFYFYYLGGGGIKITDFDVGTQRPFVVREASHGDYLLAGSVAGKIKNRIDFGVTVKIIYKDIDTISGYGLTADFGLLYKYNGNIQFGLVVTDITSGFIRYSTGTTESIVPTLKPGLLIQKKYKDFTGRFAMSGDIKFEGIKEAAQYWMGESSLDTHFGLEGSYKEKLFGRLGFDIGNFTGGLGFQTDKFSLDLAYLHNSDFDETFRVSAGYRF